MEWAEFILAHDGEDPARLVLSRDRYPGVDVALAAATIESRRKLRHKVPEWYGHPELILPLRLSAEQCSSTATARYKASLAKNGLAEGFVSWEAGHPRPVEGEGPAEYKLFASQMMQEAVGGAGMERSGMESSQETNPSAFYIADLTGGLGVDSWAFSQVASEVLYNEALPELCEAARQNFSVLGAENIRVRSHRLGEVPLREVLGDFRPDLIFLDPARRGAGGRKVFLLEDCSPDVTALLPELLAAAPFVLLKLSPMADISMLLRRLPHVREVHAVAAGGECKELLLLLERGFEGEPEMVAAEIPDQVRNDGTVVRNDDAAVRGGNDALRFRRSEEAAAVPSFGAPSPGALLFEPGKALSKAGCFNLLSERYGLPKLGPDTHLYLSAYVPSVDDGGVRTKMPENVRTPISGKRGTYSPESLLSGKWFRIVEILPLDKRGIAEAGRKYPSADVSARGVPLSSDELSVRLRKAAKKKIPEQVRNDAAELVRNDAMEQVRNDAPLHIFGVRCASLAANLLLVCQPLI